MNIFENDTTEQNIERKLQQNYKNYMDNVTVDNELHQRLLHIPEQRPIKRRPPYKTIKNFTLVAASICILALSFGALISISGGTDSDAKNAPMEMTDSKKAESTSPELYPAAKAPMNPSDSQEETAKETYLDQPFVLSGEDTTYQAFMQSFMLSYGSSQQQSDKTYKAVANPNKEIVSKLTAKLPAALQDLEVVKQEVTMVGDNAALSLCLRSSTDSDALLYVNVHPILDFELDLFVSTSDIDRYSLNLQENAALPSDESAYTDTLLYPIFVDSPITDKVLTSRQYTVNGTSTIAFGMNHDDSIITIEAINFPVKELTTLLK